MKNESLYDPKFVRSLFDEMATTYGLVNLLSSFGFTIWWRRKCAREISVKQDAVIADLMTGMGELCVEISKDLSQNGELIAIDISPVMCRRAAQHKFDHRYRVIETDALASSLGASSVDHVYSSFGLKTFNDQQLAMLGQEVARILRPGGSFAFLEISVPPNRLLQLPYMFYLTRIVPMLGRLLLGNPENYRLLGVYTAAFGNCKMAGKLFEACGLTVEYKPYFFGCASSIVGAKPTQNDE